jgi:hypothetical protein
VLLLPLLLLLLPPPPPPLPPPPPPPPLLLLLLLLLLLPPPPPLLLLVRRWLRLLLLLLLRRWWWRRRGANLLNLSCGRYAPCAARQVAPPCAPLYGLPEDWDLWAEANNLRRGEVDIMRVRAHMCTHICSLAHCLARTHLGSLFRADE